VTRQRNQRRCARRQLSIFNGYGGVQSTTTSWPNGGGVELDSDWFNASTDSLANLYDYVLVHQIAGVQLFFIGNEATCGQYRSSHRP
jgi:hypothetical protein